MQQIFLGAGQFQGDLARISGADHLHLARALRAKVGEKVVLLDGAGQAFAATVTEIGKRETTARIDGIVETLPEPPIHITVAQALGKGDKFEQVVQHGTEAGASAFVPVRAERSVADIPAAKIPDRLERWRQIAKGAAEQSGRSRIAEISEPLTFAQLVKQAQKDEIPLLLLHTDGNAPSLRTVLEAGLAKAPRLMIAIGPEGGWSSAEVSAALASNQRAVTLGPRILRTETAALVAISQILYASEGNREQGTGNR